jgi:hypothetical protein
LGIVPTGNTSEWLRENWGKDSRCLEQNNSHK